MRLYRQWLHARAFAAAAMLLAIASCATPGTPAPDAEVAKKSATDAAEKMQLAMGGSSAFEKLRFLRFDFIEEKDGKVIGKRTHFLDRETGRARVEERSNPGRTRITCLNYKKPELYSYNAPQIAVDPNAANGAKAGAAPEIGTIDTGKILAEALAELRGDSFWLLSGAALPDAAADFAAEGTKKIGETQSPTFALTVPRGSDMAPPGRYEYHLESVGARPLAWTVPEPETGAPTLFYWREWRMVGKALLPVRFESPGGQYVVRIDMVSTPEKINDVVFMHP